MDIVIINGVDYAPVNRVTGVTVKGSVLAERIATALREARNGALEQAADAFANVVYCTGEDAKARLLALKEKPEVTEEGGA